MFPSDTRKVPANLLLCSNDMESYFDLIGWHKLRGTYVRRARSDRNWTIFKLVMMLLCARRIGRGWGRWYLENILLWFRSNRAICPMQPNKAPPVGPLWSVLWRGGDLTHLSHTSEWHAVQCARTFMDNAYICSFIKCMKMGKMGKKIFIDLVPEWRYGKFGEPDVPIRVTFNDKTCWFCHSRCHQISSPTQC